MRKPTFGQRRGKPPPAGARQERQRPTRLDANFPEARGTIASPKRPQPQWMVRKLAERKHTQNAGAASKHPSPTEQRPVGSGRPTETMRIAKAMARAGLCSRREAERWITEGRVQVNGKAISSPALDVGPRDRIAVDGAPMPDAEPVRLWRYHKPVGLVTTHKDPEGRPTVFDQLPSDLPRVVSIGRLDFNTEGLLLLTNDGELARHLELPSTGWLRKYRVRVFGNVTQAQLDVLKEGIEIDGVRYGPIEATLDSTQGRNSWLTIGLREGKNREVRNILGSLDLTVNRLIRISYGPFQLLDLEQGKAESVKRRVIADQLGPELTKRFHLEPPPEAKPQPAKPRRPKS